MKWRIRSMTSQKSLRRRVNSNDFRLSFKTALPFPAVALAVLLLFFTRSFFSYVLSDDFKNTRVHDEISMFAEPPIIFSFFMFGMVACGVLTAIYQYRFLFTKKQSNVYLSMGVSRSTLYLNRAASGLICLFASVLIPFLIIYIGNIAYFGISKHLTQVFVYTVFALTASAFAGFGMGAVACASSGCIFEALVTTVSGFAVLPVLGLVFAQITNSLVNGYSYSYDSVIEQLCSLLSPWDFIMSKQYEGYDRCLRAVTLDTQTKKIPALQAIDSSMVIPAVCWFAAALLLLVLAFVLIKKRKAESAQSVGRIAFSRGAYSLAGGLAAGALAMLFAAALRPFSLALSIAAGVVAALVAIFLIRLIFSRKLKIALRGWKQLIPAAAVLVLLLVCVSTGYFGLYNRLPATEDIKSAAVGYSGFGVLANEGEVHRAAREGIKSEFLSTSPKDIETAQKIFELVKNDKETKENSGIEYIEVVFELKDGKKMSRSFRMYSDDIYTEYEKQLVESEYFDKCIDLKLKSVGLFSKGMTEQESFEYYYGGGMRAYGVAYDGDYVQEPTPFVLVSSTGVVNTEKFDLSEGLTEEQQAEISKCIYEDISKMSWEQLCRNKNGLYGMLSTGYSWEAPLLTDTHDGYYFKEGGITAAKISIANLGIPVLNDMTKTVAYLKENGIEPLMPPSNVKEILYTKECGTPSLKGDAVYAVKKASDMNPVDSFFDWDNPYEKLYDAIINRYQNIGAPLKKLSYQEGKELIDFGTGFYTIAGEKGGCIFVVYEDNSCARLYVPESRTLK